MNGSQNQAAALFVEGEPSGRKKGGIAMITYSEMIEFCMFVVALVGLCYQIFKDKRN